MIETFAALIVGLVIGAMLGYHFALDATLRLMARSKDPVVRSEAKSLLGGEKPREVKFFPNLTDDEAGKEDGELQAKIKGMVHQSAKQIEDAE